MRSKFLFAVLACLCLLLCSPASHAQANGSFSGTVLDKSGANVVGAKITATSQVLEMIDVTATDFPHFLHHERETALRLETVGVRPEGFEPTTKGL